MKTRRGFLKYTAVASAGFTVFPGNDVSGLGHKIPADKLNNAGVGIGGKGHPKPVSMNPENIMPPCDVDWNYSGKCFRESPNAKRYRDWQKMFDEMGNSLDGFMVATPRYTHAAVVATVLITYLL